MSRFINPFTDFGFKKIFGQEVNSDLLIDFLNSLLTGERHILDIEFMDKERHGRSAGERSLIYDIYCKTDTGEYIIVEMQNRKQNKFLDRMLFYTSRSIAEQGEKGRLWDYNIKAVYGIAFMNFTDDTLSEFRTDAIIADKSTGRQMSDKLRLIFLQLPLFKIEDPEKCSSDFERWIYVLKNMETLERMPYAAKSKVFKKLESISNLSELTPRERQKYDEAIRIMRDNYTFELEAKQRLEEAIKKAQEEAMARGLKEGVEKGMEEGLEKGMQKGMQKGIEKGMEKGLKDGILQTARNMFDRGIDVDIIAACTGLSADYIRNNFKKEQ